MHTENPYSRFQNEPTVASTSTAPIPVTSVSSTAVENETSDNYRRIRILSIASLALSTLILVFGIIATTLVGLLRQNPDMLYYIITGTASICTAIVGIAAACSGLGIARRRTEFETRCLLTAYLVLTIAAAVLSELVIIFGALCLSQAPWLPSPYASDEGKMFQAAIAFVALIFVASLAQLILSIFSSAFICRFWSGGFSISGRSTIAYIPTQVLRGSGGGMEAFTVPAGAQIVFVPVSNTQTELEADVHSGRIAI